MLFRSFAAAFFVLLAAFPAAGHEFWIEPSSYHPEAGSLVAARLRVGEHFLGDPVPRNDEHLLRFVLAGQPAAGQPADSPMVGTDGRDPAGLAKIPADGYFLIGYESRATAVEVEGELLARYLEEEGLAPFYEGDPRGPIRDHFSRYAKSLLLAGEHAARSPGFDRVLGLALELVPEAAPALLPAGGPLPLRLLLAGKPLAGVQVSARSRARPLDKAVARTDAAGRVRLPIAGPGTWLINAVYLRPLAGQAGEWESLWASLTFEIPASGRPD